MTEIACLTFPLLGRFLLIRDDVSVSRWSVEPLDGEDESEGAEHLVCLGKLRLYLTPNRTLTSERPR